MINVRLLGPGDASVLDHVADGVFDHPIDPRWSTEFLNDPRHHLTVTMENGRIIGMASGVHYVHPDKPPELWINAVGVAPSHQGRGIGRQLLRLLLAHGRSLGCRQAWVLTHHNNTAARKLYAAVGDVEDAPTPPVMFTFDLGESTNA